jgi:tRNA A-37 threonylcarbamoyl transferase component Bud32/tetratricopeptide (TPR) repeat protein
MELLLAAAIAVAALSAGALYGARFARRRVRLKRAQARLESGDVLGAAALFQEAGDRASAAALYAQGGERIASCNLYLAFKDFDAAVEALRGAKADEVQQGLELLARSPALEEPARAGALAAMARKASLHTLAADLFERAGNPDEARASRLQEARSLSANGRPLEAAALYQRLGEARAAAAAHAEAARREADPVRRRELAEKASALLQEAGDLPGAAEALAIAGGIERGVDLLLAAQNRAGAAQLLQWHGHHARAGELLEAAGDLRSAARAYANAGDPRRAAGVLERAGDPIAAVRLLLEAHDATEAAEVHLRAGAPGAAAEILAGAGDVDGAVKIYLQFNELDDAVELLVRRGRPRDAATLLESRGEPHRAAVLLAESGDLAQRARLLESSGNFEGAAQAYLDFGQPIEARRVLALCRPLAPLGRFLLGRACMASADYGEACQHFSALLDTPPRGIPRVDVLYALARAFEAQDRIREAVTTLEELAAVDVDYRDAPFRLRLLKARLEPSAPIPLTESPLPGGEPGPDWLGPSSEAEGARVRPEGVPARYSVEKEIGRGAMGVVYRALDTQLGRTVAIKVLDRKTGADPRIRKYFLREARAIAQLIHPNIVTLFDAGLEGASPYLVMELVEGDDLRTRLQRGRLALLEAVQLIAGVAHALGYAHDRQIVHRDVKPENILVNQEGQGKLMDFGVAHVMRAGERQATIIGTPVYMSPEQIKGESIGGFTDTYALGAVLYECLVGAPPFDPNGALFHHVNTAPPDPRVFRPEVPQRLAEAVLACLAKAPADRPATGKALGDTLLALAPTLRAA